MILSVNILMNIHFQNTAFERISASPQILYLTDVWPLTWQSYLLQVLRRERVVKLESKGTKLGWLKLVYFNILQKIHT